MESKVLHDGPDDSVEAIRALEAGIKIIARLIVKALVAELREQEKYFSEIGGVLPQAFSIARPTANQPGRNAVFTVEEAGKLLGISRATAYECVRTGQIPNIRFGKRILVPRVALLKMLDEMGPFTSRQNK
jgi:excisionase family DNA binding protein